MTNLQKTDLHMHSTISDGTNTPEELLALVRDAGIPLFAVTDHDAIKAYGIIREIRTAEDPYLISGVEFSCRDELGHYHILGYGYDPDSTPVQNVVKHGHQLRMKKVKGETRSYGRIFTRFFARGRYPKSTAAS